VRLRKARRYTGGRPLLALRADPSKIAMTPIGEEAGIPPTSLKQR
jgi:hypothetical protein